MVNGSIKSYNDLFLSVCRTVKFVFEETSGYFVLVKQNIAGVYILLNSKILNFLQIVAHKALSLIFCERPNDDKSCRVMIMNVDESLECELFAHFRQRLKRTGNAEEIINKWHYFLLSV